MNIDTVLRERAEEVKIEEGKGGKSPPRFKACGFSASPSAGDTPATPPCVFAMQLVWGGDGSGWGYWLEFTGEVYEHSGKINNEPPRSRAAPVLNRRFPINCVVFRYGRPSHRGMEDSVDWQKKLNKTIEERRKLFMVHEMEGKIKLVSNSLVHKNLTVSKNTPFAKFNVS